MKCPSLPCVGVGAGKDLPSAVGNALRGVPAPETQEIHLRYALRYAHVGVRPGGLTPTYGPPRTPVWERCLWKHRLPCPETPPSPHLGTGAPPPVPTPARGNQEIHLRHALRYALRYAHVGVRPGGLTPTYGPR